MRQCVRILPFFAPLKSVHFQPSVFPIGKLLKAGTQGDIFSKGGENRLSVFAVRSGKQHAVRLETAHLAWGQVGDNDDSLADQLFGRVPLGNAGENLALLITKIDLETKQLVRFRDTLGDDNLRNPEVNLDEVVNRDLR